MISHEHSITSEGREGVIHTPSEEEVAMLQPADAEKDVKWWDTIGVGSLIMVCALGTTEGAELSLLGATFRGLEIELGFDAAVLSTFNVIGITSFGLACPFWGALADRFPRKPIALTGLVGWMTCLGVMSMCSEKWQFYLFRFINGLFTATMAPVLQSIIADVVPAADRGKVFGGVAFFTNTGLIISSYVGTILSQTTIHGIAGWRWAYAGLSIVAVLFGCLFACIFREPDVVRRPDPFTFSAEFARIKSYLAVPSFCTIVAQGVAGVMPWHAMTLLVLYFQYSGLTDAQVGLLLGLRTMFGAFGVLFGGYFGDWWERRWKDHGRVNVAVLSVLLGIPTCVSVLYIPHGPHFYLWTVVMSCLFQLVATWPASVNRPILSEIVTSKDRASIIGWEMAF